LVLTGGAGIVDDPVFTGGAGIVDDPVVLTDNEFKLIKV
jgi:hypothetical protein